MLTPLAMNVDGNGHRGSEAGVNGVFGASRLAVRVPLA
jgi:hypothetical protein